MASLSAIMTKRGQAKKRIDAATEQLVEIFGIDVPPSPGNVAQSELRHALELDRLATILESILESTDPGQSDDGDDGEDGADSDSDDSTTEPNGADPTEAERTPAESVEVAGKATSAAKPAAARTTKPAAKPVARRAGKAKPARRKQ